MCDTCKIFGDEVIDLNKNFSTHIDKPEESFFGKLYRENEEKKAREFVGRSMFGCRIKLEPKLKPHEWYLVS